MTSDAGVSFREVMAGWFALGENEPGRGERAGREARTRLVLRASLVIPNVGRFVRDPAHAGILDGSVSLHQLGADLPAASGLFRLFTPTGDPNLKLMTYRISFQSGGTSYCLEGSKHVRRGSPLRGWKDTTTLPCRLYAGADDSGPIVGAGVLRLTPVSFARQLFSFRAVNGRTVGAKARALTGFFGFFARELVETYL